MPTVALLFGCQRMPSVVTMSPTIPVRSTPPRLTWVPAAGVTAAAGTVVAAAAGAATAAAGAVGAAAGIAGTGVGAG